MGRFSSWVVDGAGEKIDMGLDIEAVSVCGESIVECDCFGLQEVSIDRGGLEEVVEIFGKAEEAETGCGEEVLDESDTATDADADGRGSAFSARHNRLLKLLESEETSSKTEEEGDDDEEEDDDGCRWLVSAKMVLGNAECGNSASERNEMCELCWNMAASQTLSSEPRMAKSL